MPVTACPACHSRAFTMISIGSESLKRCKDCGLPYAPAYVDPDEIYREGYHTGEIGSFGVDVSHPEWAELLEFVGERRMQILESVVPTPGRILDVGCGPGHFLASAKRRGWDAVGVELVPSAAQTATEQFGLEVHNSMLEDSGLPERSFDVVAATHVLEHQLDGVAFLTSIGRWVKPGGHLFIEVPNWSSIDRMGNKDRWFGLRPLEHLAHYSPRTLAKTMKRIGFEPVAIRTPIYQNHRQTMGQSLQDFGLARFAPYLRRDWLTVPGVQRGGTVRMPNAVMLRVLSGLEWATVAAKAGVVVVMIARVP
jgi:SAM-dependent methyltransferase